jgi:hypothetical protein
MLKIFLYQDGSLFSEGSTGSKVFPSDEKIYKFKKKPFSSMWTDEVLPMLWHSFWFNNEFGSSYLFARSNDSWEWALENMVFGPNWREQREKY